jgi:hypothetical protein
MASNSSCGGDTFHLLDLPSQAAAVQALLAGRPLDEKVKWLDSHGRLSLMPLTMGSGKQVYIFESYIGMQCKFFIAGDDLVFIGDNTYWKVPWR